MSEGRWVSVTEFAQYMGISRSYVRILARRGKVIMKYVWELDREGYAQIGRGWGNNCLVVWLPDDLMNIRQGAGRRKRVKL